MGIFSNSRLSSVNIDRNTVFKNNSMCNAFRGCTNLKTLVTIPNNVTDVSYMYANCTQLNTGRSLPSSVTNARGMFYGCNNMNTNTSIIYSYSVEDASYMYAYCSNFNQWFQLSSLNNLTNMAYMFSCCYNLKFYSNSMHRVDAPNVTNMAYMFNGCRNFHAQNIVLPNSVLDLTGMFCNGNAPSDINIPKNVTNIAYMFASAGVGNVRSMNINILSPNITNVKGLFSGCYNNYYKNIYVPRNSVTNATFACNNANSIIGTTIKWTNSTNYRYNSTYKINIYWNRF